MHGFKIQTEYREKIARDNLAYFEENGFSALNPHFDAFLSALNRNMFYVYPQAEAEIKLPKEFSEKDRALLAHGLVTAMGPDIQIRDYFEIPGYRLKQSNAFGTISVHRIKSKLESNKVIKDGSFQHNTVELIFTDNQRPNK